MFHFSTFYYFFTLAVYFFFVADVKANSLGLFQSIGSFNKSN
jgi:hypothetical protein